MLAKRIAYKKIIDAMKGNPFVIEPKLDGERLLCHKVGNSLKLHTRNGTDYTRAYGEGVLAPWILSQLDCQVG
jgi:DNA ligase-4